MTIRNVDETAFLRTIASRPATIRYLSNPSPRFLAKCLVKNCEVADYMESSLFSLELLEIYAEELINHVGEYRRQNDQAQGILKFPSDTRVSLSPDKVEKLVHKYPYTIDYLPSASYQLWLEHTEEKKFEFEKIPVRHRTYELLGLFYSESYELPDGYLNDTVVDIALDKNPDVILHLTKQFKTADRFKRAFKAKSEISVDERDIPRNSKFWDQELANLAYKYQWNIRCIPSKFITKQMCLEVLSNIAALIEYIPKRYIDEDTVLVAMSSGILTGSAVIPESLLTEELLIKLAELDAQSGSGHGIQSFYRLKGWTTSWNTQIEELWVKVLKIYPRGLTFIDKNSQSDAIITAFLENAPIELVDDLVSYINLRKLKKEHVPFLIGSKDQTILDLITTKLTTKSKKERNTEAIVKIQENVKEQPCVQVDMTDSEFLEGFFHSAPPTLKGK